MAERKKHYQIPNAAGESIRRPNIVNGREIGARFVAGYESLCAYCDGEIEAGDPAGYVDNDVHCGDCWEAARDGDL